MKRRDFNKNIAALALSAPFMPALSSFASEDRPESLFHGSVGKSLAKFPAQNNYTLKTNPVFVITHKGQTEVLLFKSNMDYTAHSPKKNRAGFRYAEVKLADWQGKAHSKLLGKEVSFKVTNSDRSKFVSNYLNQDFPSNLQLNLEFDLMAGNEVIKRGIAARIDTTLDGIVPSPQNLLKIDSTSLNIGKNRDMDVVFLSA
jgi:hypothetical protein